MRILKLKYHGRIIDQLGIQMYQSPVAAIAELISNAWDADAENVWISLPTSLHDTAELTIRDDGIGMTFKECDERYLNVGWCRRVDDPGQKSPGGRPVLGRKGIGKFAGFGIAYVVHVETTSKATGERTSFELDIEKLRSNEYVAEGGDVTVTGYNEPDEIRKTEHGTTVSLRSLKLKRLISLSEFLKSMSRRFLLHETAQNFKVFVNGFPLPVSENRPGVEFSFPSAYRQSEKPDGLISIKEGWGIERLPNAKEITWRIDFYEDTIDEEELRGVSIFSRGKLVQSPFFFQLSGGLGGQHGQAYMSGQVQADYLDSLPEDIISTERQRVNWEHDASIPLVEWGKERVKELLRIWRDRRGEKRRRELEEKLTPFAQRLARLPRHEQATVKRALTRLGGIPTLSRLQFEELAGAILTSWEQGRLRDLIYEISSRADLSANQFLELLTEAQVLSALNIAEAVKTRIEAIRGLQRRVDMKELENPIRDYVAEKPWLLHPKWETFKKEVSVNHLLDEAATEAGLTDKEFKGRIDLALRSGEHLLVVEFMRPGKESDWDHLSRCRRYIHKIRGRTEAESQLGIKHVTGLIVADGLHNADDIKREVEELAKTEIYAYSWRSLIAEAEAVWRDFLDILVDRAPDDQRLRELKNAG